MKKFLTMLIFAMCCIAGNAQTASWAGKYLITGSIYRNDWMEATLVLNKDASGNYSGTIRIEANGGSNGVLTGKVSAKSSNPQKLSVTLTSFKVSDGKGTFNSDYYARPRSGVVIFEIRRGSTAYSVSPANFMCDYFDGLSDPVTIEKVR